MRVGEALTMLRLAHQGPPRELPPGFYVYTLRAKGDGVRYVGLTQRPRRRWYLHVSNATGAERAVRRDLPVYVWIRAVVARGERPVMDIVHLAKTLEQGERAELRAIRSFLRDGAPLLNVIGGVIPVARKLCTACGERGHIAKTCGRPAPVKLPPPAPKPRMQPPQHGHRSAISPARAAVRAIREARAQRRVLGHGEGA
jgi:GIY-YIG catalytic domain